MHGDAADGRKDSGVIIGGKCRIGQDSGGVRAGAILAEVPSWGTVGTGGYLLNGRERGGKRQECKHAWAWDVWLTNALVTGKVNCSEVTVSMERPGQRWAVR